MPNHWLPWGSSEVSRHILPWQFFSPESQVLHIGCCQLFFTPGPGYLFHFDATGLAVNASHHVQKEHPVTQQWNKLKAPFAQRIITRRSRVAPWANRLTISARRDSYLDDVLSEIAGQAHLKVNKRLELLPLIQDSFNQHLLLALLFFWSQQINSRFKQQVLLNSPYCFHDYACLSIFWVEHMRRTSPASTA